ncbi:putative glycerol-3-phosphate dehydrogenase (NAD(+)) [Helianthus annuus]|nr:putative glycerol-3-phosphate dehydrogenase (NAD(+)) [Helianthus annuus]
MSSEPFPSEFLKDTSRIRRNRWKLRIIGRGARLQLRLLAVGAVMVVVDRLIFAGRLLGLAYIGIRSQCWRLFMNGRTKQEMCRAFAKNGGKRSFDDLQAEMLQGQKL